MKGDLKVKWKRHGVLRCLRQPSAEGFDAFAIGFDYEDEEEGFDNEDEEEGFDDVTTTTTFFVRYRLRRPLRLRSTSTTRVG
ncbi:hypothetical protein FNV43_RR09722 [Rhamnella rubrinervis]|uniref:Uncharacterized protein n=1 Tax=Rhamnella rubrinervis TaxID=2594499 RepID=A0A8K0HBB0_9ROSA|nr:hypothetical protein FNV43_RR09722 [Rhamnella rubrinervis]